MAQRIGAVLAVLLALAALPAAAEGLADPTRPAVGVDEDIAAAGTPSGPRLQLIKISAVRRIAIIDGQEVTIGSRIGEMRVISITEGEVVLRGKTERETLKLFADVDKRPLAAPRAEKGAANADKARAARPTRKKTDADASRKAQP